jgi:signal transduction histidine kinase
MEERNLFLDKVLDASPTGVVNLDHDGCIAQINPAVSRMTGMTAEQLLGRPVDELPAPIGAMLRDLEDGGSAVVSFHGSRRLKCHHGSFYDRGFSRRFFLLEELTEELRASEKAAYGKLIRMMSHEVNNSTGAVRSLLESCQSYGEQLREADRGDFDQAMQVAADRLHHLNSFMNGLATVVRVPTPEKRPCDLRQLLSDIALLMQPELEQRKIRLDWQPPASFPEPEVDKNQIEQVLVNVMKNAIDAIDRDGTLTLSLSTNGNKPQLSVRDSGPGIPPEVQPHLFTPFYSTKREGQGVGLTLIREILIQHDLDFDLRNVPPHGAEFRIFF